jgi:tripartite-type tricarboxylate transporter receptor subunit TctC
MVRRAVEAGQTLMRAMLRAVQGRAGHAGPDAEHKGGPMQSNRFRRVLLVVFAVLALAPALVPAQAQDYPNRLVRLIVAFPPGGGADIAARLIAQKLSDGWGKPVIVESRPGAQGSVASEYVAKQAPDGYTLLLSIAGSHASAQHLVSNLPYDPFRDFAAVTLLASTPFGLTVNASSPYRNVKEFVDYARANTVNYGSAGHGSITHMSGELLKLSSEARLVHVPYKGTGPAVQDLLGGHIQMVVVDIGSVKPQVIAGKLRLLAVTGSARSNAFPDVPTFAEAGYPGFETGGWYGIFAPTGTPRNILERVAADTTRIIRSPEVSQRMVELGWEPGGGTPEEFFAYWKASADHLGDIIRRAKIKVE